MFSGYPGSSDLDGTSGILEAHYRGESIQVRRIAGNQYEMVRLLSTRPGMFLKEEFQPGRVIDGRELNINS